MKNIFILIFSILISSFAHLFLKKGVSGSRFEDLINEGFYSLFIYIISNPWIVGGMFLHGCALVVWLFALSRVDISFAYPFLALGYVIISIMAWLWLGETVTATRMMGMLIIITGLVVLSRGG